MKISFFETNNYHRMVGAVEALKERDPHLPGMGLVYGRWGLGKSAALDHFYGVSNIYYVRAEALLGPRDLLEAICDEFKIHPEYRTVARFRQVAKEMRRRREPLFIDEADYLFKRQISLDVIRDLHDVTNVPIVLVGMEAALGKLERYGQFWSRILPAGIVLFKPLTPPEMIVITREWTGLGLEPEAAEMMCHYTEGDFRLIVNFLSEVERACKVNNLDQVSQAMIDAVSGKLSKNRDFIETGKQQQRRLYTIGRKAVTEKHI